MTAASKVCAGVGPDAAVVDVGGGASTLVDHLLDQGFGRLSVLDVSGQALAVAKTRLGERAGRRRLDGAQGAIIN